MINNLVAECITNKSGGCLLDNKNILWKISKESGLEKEVFI